MKVVIIFISFILSASSLAALETQSGDYLFGVRGGYSTIFGNTFSDDLNNSPYFSISIIPYVSKYIMIEGSFSYMSYGLDQNESAYLDTYNSHIGPLLYLSIFPFWNIYAGAAMQNSYIFFNSDTTSETIRKYKPGFSFQSGFFFPLWSGLRIRTGVQYTQIWISNSPFRTINYFASVSFNVKSFIRTHRVVEKSEPISPMMIKKQQKNEYFSKAMEEFNNNNLLKAQKNFKKVLEIDKSHIPTKKYLKAIIMTLNEYNKGKKLFEKKQYFKAIPYLKNTENKYEKSKKLLKMIKNVLFKQIPILERQGMLAYNQKRYKDCITIMKRLRLIQPSNEKVKLYLPRAQKRYNAFKKFR